MKTIKNKYINALKSTICIMCVCFAVLNICAAPSSEAFGWYFNKNENHLPPALPSEFRFIDSSDGYYLDKNAREDDKVIYLTFDVGYENGNVAKILDALKKHSAKGAFFILSNVIDREPDLVMRMKNEGHLICNHTAKHKDMSKVTDHDAFCNELKSLDDKYYSFSGTHLDPFYRPPEGRFNESNLKDASSIGYKTVFWSYAYADWDNNKQMNPDKAYEKVMNHVHNGMVILLHPTSATNAEIMDRLLCGFEELGYRFGDLYELTGTEKGNI